MSEIRPALDAEDWEWVSGRGPLPGIDPGRWSDHALAALALHGQPFGFTWEDVDLLHEIKFRNEAEADELGLLAKSLADRIAALLPPRP